MTTDFRALCVELLEWAEQTSAHYVVHPDVVLRARAALAQPKPEGVVTPTLPGGVPLTGGLSWLIPTLDDVVELCEEFGFELHEDNESGDILWEMFRAVLARWGSHD